MQFKDIIQEKIEFFKKQPGLLYHVTETKNVNKIKKEGIVPKKKPTMTGMFGADIRQAKDAIYAFELYAGAFAWAFKRGWDGKTKISIITFKKSGTWKEDTHWEAQTSDNGKWLYKQGSVKPSEIKKVEQFDANDNIKAQEFIKQRDKR